MNEFPRIASDVCHENHPFGHAANGMLLSCSQRHCICRSSSPTLPTISLPCRASSWPLQMPVRQLGSPNHVLMCDKKRAWCACYIVSVRVLCQPWRVVLRRVHAHCRVWCKYLMWLLSRWCCSHGEPHLNLQPSALTIIS